jgi:ribonuclease HI
MSEDVVYIYTDGACRGNPGPGGWAALVRWHDHEKEITGYEPATTNNRMEMMAAIKGLETLKRPLKVHIYTDSQYLREGMANWIHTWKAKNWKTANKQPVKNIDLWQQLEALQSAHTVEWHWVKGHAGHPENERVNSLAQNALIAAHVLAIDEIETGTQSSCL